MKNSKAGIVALSLSLATTLLTGCAAILVGAAVGAGTVVYVNGQLKAADDVSLDRAWNASLAAMDSLQFKVTKQQRDALAGNIVARGADDRKVEIWLKKQTDKVTEVRIRVGFFGDETLSRTIHSEIQKHF